MRVVKQEATISTNPEKSDFLTEEGYYTWMDRLEQVRQDPRLEFSVLEMLNLWDLEHPLMSDEHLNSRSRNARKQANNPDFQTTMNLVVRIIEARALLPDSKGRGRNCIAVIEYPQPNGDKSRFETGVVENTLDPMWNQQITLTVNNLMDPITVTVYHRKEKSGLFGDDVRDEFVGCKKLNVQELVSQCAKNGFVDEWYKLNNVDGKDKFRKMPVSGEIRIETEMGGTMDVETFEDNEHLPPALRSLKEIHHRMIKHKVNLKKLFCFLLQCIVRMDICIPETKDITKIPMKKTPYSLTKYGDYILKQFAALWSITDVFRKMKYLDVVFAYFKRQRLHAHALILAYRSLHEGIWRKGTIWLPNYEVIQAFYSFFDCL